MAGIYIHIPFCKQKCYYCDFFSIASFRQLDNYIEAILKEINLQKNYLSDEIIETIYFGGGTPSVLKISHIKKILSQIHQNFKINKFPEITFEANPEHLDKTYLQELKNININRLSVGVQSFDDDDLKSMNRKHQANLSIELIKNAQEIGFKNITIDLIYGLPNMTKEKWLKQLNQAFSLNIQHLSAYHLIYEKKTVFYKYLQKGKIKAISENESIEEFETLIKEAGKNNFIHYEISNFAKEDFFSKHNSNYWLQKKYLGIGASAHSYNIKSRHWNISNIKKYIDGIEQNKLNQEIEFLDKRTQYNDYILVRLRTIWGINTEDILSQFGEKYKSFFLENIKVFLQEKHVFFKKNNFYLTDTGKLIADNITLELFYFD